MPLSSDRFFKGDTRFKGADNRIRPAEVFSYETHTTLYDVLRIEDMLFVRVNSGRLGLLISDWKPIHYSISHHFGLFSPISKEACL